MRKYSATGVACVVLIGVVGISGLAIAKGKVDGPYKGTVNGKSVKVKHLIKSGGSKIKNFDASQTVLCYNGSGFEPKFVIVGFGSAKIKRNGKFSGRLHPGSNLDLRYKGKLNKARRKASGHVEGHVGACPIKFDWHSKHK